MVAQVVTPTSRTESGPETRVPGPTGSAVERRLEAVLRDRFGLQEFRPWQKEAILAVLSGRGPVLVVAPTGGGKSLTYQVPAIVLEGTTLVLSPLVALIM